MPSKRLLGFLLIAAAGILWGGMGTAVQHLFSVDRAISPLGLVTLRQLAAGTIFVLILALASPKRAFSVFRTPRIFGEVALSGVLLLSAHYTFFEAIYYSNAGTGAILLTLVPLLAGGWIAFRTGEKMTAVELFCFLLAASGVALIMTNGDFGALRFSPLAIAWGLVSAAAGAAYSIQPLKVIREIGVAPVVAWGLVAGGLCASIFSPPWLVHMDWTLEGTLSFGYIVLFGTVAAFWCYLSGLKWISPVVAGLLNCLEPLSAFFFSIVLLGDRIGAVQAIGIALVVSNVALLALAKGRR